MNNEKLAKTPLHQNHLQLGARMVPFAGYDMPVQYTSVLEETKSVRKNCGLFDVSHMGQFSLRGLDAVSEIAKLVTNDPKRLKIGQAQYNMLCNPEGGVIDDLVVYRRSETQVYICVNASNRFADFDWMKSHLGTSVSFEDESDETSLLAVQGPKAESVIVELVEPSVARSLKYYWAVDTTILGFPSYLSRTGYTGEDGFEIYVKNTHASELWDALLDRGHKYQLTPCGLGARDTLRLEMGYPLHGHELSTTISPLSAGLAWTVKLQREDSFIGQNSLRMEASAGSKRILKGFVVHDRRIARQGYEIAVDTGNGIPKRLGEISSGTFSPHLNTPIALGFIDSNYLEHGGKIVVQVRDSHIPSEAVKLPFVKPGVKR